MAVGLLPVLAVAWGVQARAVAPLPDLQHVAEHAMPAIVAIGVEQPAPDSPHMDFSPIEGTRSKPRRGLGTGFVIRSDGYIVTNCHVVEGATRIEVAVGLGSEVRRYPGRTVGCDDPTDLAVVKIEPSGPLPTLTLGDSDKLHIAQWVLTIGNPFGLTRSVTAGIVSQLNREDISPQGRHGYFDFIQTDAPINPGSSGGPILDLDGRVVGIANAVHAGGQGIAFAIPVNMLSVVLPQLMSTGRVVRSWLGIHVVDAPSDTQDLLGGRRGILVDDVVAGGPGDRAGLHVGDVILDYGSRGTFDPEHMRWDVANAGVGRTLRMTVWRAGHVLDLPATLIRMPDPIPARPPPSIPGLGVVAVAADPPGPFEEAFGGEGARILRIAGGSPATAAGLEEGDVVVEMNGRPVHSPAALLIASAAMRDGAMVRLVVRRSGGPALVSFRKSARCCRVSLP